MVFAEALELLGAPGWAVVIGMTAIALWHFRSLMQLLGNVATVVKVGVGIVAVLVILWTGLIPGVQVDFTVVPTVLLEFVNSIISTVAGVIGSVL